MAFEHLTNLYANFYLARKRAYATKTPLSEDLAAMKKAEREYYSQLRAFEQYLDVLGNNQYNQYIDSLVKYQEKMGVIRKKIDKGWEIEWYSINTLKPLGTTIEPNLSHLEFIQTD